MACLVEDLDSEPCRCANLGGAVGKNGRGEDVRGLVRQLARDVAGLAENTASLRGVAKNSFVSLGPGDDDQLGQRRRRAFAALVGVAAEE